MIFGKLTLDSALGTILVHSIKVGKKTFRKGRTLSQTDINALHTSNILEITAVRLEDNDVHENQAAERLAKIICGKNLRLSKTATGRCNLVTETDGIAMINKEGIDKLNLTNEAIAISTVTPFAKVSKGDVVATVKIITFGIIESALKRCQSLLKAKEYPVSLAPFKKKKVGLLQTRLPILRESLLNKAKQVTQNRLQKICCDLTYSAECNHDLHEVANGIKELISADCKIALILGASAIADRKDIIPAAIEECNGSVFHFGLPVDPGNLMLMGKIGAMHVLGLPGSARSPRLHGFDWVLERLVADIEVTSRDLMTMGVGGLLKEIHNRPLPRVTAVKNKTVKKKNPKIVGVILAAGQSRRMGAINKLLENINGKPMICHAVEAALQSKANPIMVVTGFEHELIKKSLLNFDVELVQNSDYGDGLSTSLRAAIKSFDTQVDGAVFCLGDMPEVRPEHINKLIDAYDPEAEKSICVPTYKGKRGNPVLWNRKFFFDMCNVSGDVGARHLIGENEKAVLELPIDDQAILIDLDTPEALKAHLIKKKNKK